MIQPIFVPLKSRKRIEEEEKESKEKSTCEGFANYQPHDTKIIVSAAYKDKMIDFSFTPEFFKDCPEQCLKMMEQQLTKLIKPA